MRKTLIYFVVFIILGVYFFLFTKQESGFSVSEAGFTIKDTAAIGRIFISNTDGNSIVAERTDSGWIVNKKYKALKSTVNMLLKLFPRQTALYPVPASMHNTVVSDMAGTGIKVELDNLKGEKMRVFYVGGETSNGNGSFMLMEGAKRPYIVNVPGFQGYLTPYYSYKLGDWRDRTIFDVAPAEIKSVSVTYPEQPVNSFSIGQEGGKVKFDAAKELTSAYTPNPHRVNSYLHFFENVNCEGYITSDNTMDSLLRVMPKHCMIDLASQQGKAQHIDIYWMPLNKRSKNMTAESPDIPDNKYDADRFFTVMNDYHDTVMIQAFAFKKIFRRAYEFYQPDTTATAKKNAEVPILPKAMRK